jgi:hypothetical protein
VLQRHDQHGQAEDQIAHVVSRRSLRRCCRIGAHRITPRRLQPGSEEPPERLVRHDRLASRARTRGSANRALELVLEREHGAHDPRQCTTHGLLALWHGDDRVSEPGKRPPGVVDGLLDVVDGPRPGEPRKQLTAERRCYRCLAPVRDRLLDQVQRRRDHQERAYHADRSRRAAESRGARARR